MIRELNKNDYIEYISLINLFRPLDNNITKEDFENIYDKIFLKNKIFVIEKNNKIVGSVKLLIEHKMIHNMSLYGRIEDVIVDNNFRNRGIGYKLIKYVVDYCKNNNFFKVTLCCNKELVPFYEKNKFEIYQVHMSQLC
mgnify:CR=1 FL=1